MPDDKMLSGNFYAEIFEFIFSFDLQLRKD